MQTTLFTVLAVAATAMASVMPRDTCTGSYYGLDACTENCKAPQTCSTSSGKPDPMDYYCICDGTDGAGCGELIQGTAACKAQCSGTCTLQLIIYNCC